MADIIIRASDSKGLIRIFAANTKNLIEEARKIHNLSPAATCALGRLLIANAMMTCFSKGDKDTLTLQIKADGPIGAIVTVGTQGVVRGYVDNPNVECVLCDTKEEDLSTTVGFGNIDIGLIVGKDGYLTIIKDMGLKEPYIGRIELVTGEITQDLIAYFNYSEQIPTVVELDVMLNKDGSVKQAGGYIIQIMPGTDVEFIEYLRNRVSQAPHITSMLDNNMTLPEILKWIFGDTIINVHQDYSCSFQCNCSRDRMINNLITLGAKEIKDIIDEVGNAELQCRFCNTFYMFDKNQLLEIYKITKS